MKKLFLFMLIILALPVMLCAGQFAPYKIKAGISYYSDEYMTIKGLSELGEEKNYEEVYQNYNYYEAVFDSQERIVIFKAYKRGVIEFSETYYYGSDGHPTKKIIKNSDGSESVVDLSGD